MRLDHLGPGLPVRTGRSPAWRHTGQPDAIGVAQRKLSSHLLRLAMAVIQ